MSKFLASVVMCTFQRRHLLERSLTGYLRQNFDNARMELVVVDDHSTDGTRELVLDWSRTNRIQATVLTVSPKPSEWVDCGKWLNYGIRVSQGKHVVLTHPEIIPGLNSLKECIRALEDFERMQPNALGLYACCKGYYLTPRDQTLLDTVDWKSSNLKVRDLPQFYEPIEGGNPDYSHTATDMIGKPRARHATWESWIWGGHSRRTWEKLGGFIESSRWGSCDISWMTRRRTLGIPNYTCVDDESIVIHCNHDLPGEVVTPRDMNAWVEELKTVDLQTPSKLVYPFVNNLCRE